VFSRTYNNVGDRQVGEIVEDVNDEGYGDVNEGCEADKAWPPERHDDCTDERY